MRILSTKIHGILDYMVGLFLLISPWVLGFAHGGAETWAPLAAGAAAIIYSLVTDYEWGAAKLISMRFHLGLDLVSGILLAASPWIFGFHDYVFLPHLILGVMEILVVLITDPNPGSGKSNSSGLAGSAYRSQK